MSENAHSTWLHRFAVFAVCCTFILIGMGGLVTSREAGLTVPDWPTSFGYNMFLLPFDQWLGKFGIFEEHAHRLMASLVGLFTAVGARICCSHAYHRHYRCLDHTRLNGRPNADYVCGHGSCCLSNGSLFGH